MLGRHDDAKQLIGRALGSDPNHAGLHRALARTHHLADEPEAALAAAQRSLALQVTPEGLHLAGASQRALGDDDGAQESYRQAIRLEPESATLRVGLALTLVAPALDRETRPADASDRLEEARRLCEAATALAPTLATPAYARGLAELAADDAPLAARWFETAIGLDPEFATAHRMLGTVRARQGMSRLASRHLATAGRLDPTDPHALSLLRRLTRPLTRRARRRGRPDTDRVVASAREIVEADLGLRDEPPTEWA